jgi:hypothetical protein
MINPIIVATHVWRHHLVAKKDVIMVHEKP